MLGSRIAWSCITLCIFSTRYRSDSLYLCRQDAMHRLSCCVRAAFWKVLYDCSQVKDLPYATLENALNELILDIFVQPTPQFKPKKFLPTLPFTYKCKFIHSSPEGIAKREALTRFYEDEEMRKRIAERKMGNRLE